MMLATQFAEFAINTDGVKVLIVSMLKLGVSCVAKCTLRMVSLLLWQSNDFLTHNIDYIKQIISKIRRFDYEKKEILLRGLRLR